MRSVKKIVLHCTATEEGKKVTAMQVDKWHKERGFRKIGYHYLIDLYGFPVFGRKEKEVGAHCVATGDTKNWYNKHSIGVCYVGGLRHGKPANTLNKYQLDTLLWLVNDICIRYGLDPDKDVICHNQVANKSCPCFKIDWFLKEYHKKY